MAKVIATTPVKPVRAKKAPVKIIDTRVAKAKATAELRSIVSNFVQYVPQSLLK
jgi:hypothetical protein